MITEKKRPRENKFQIAHFFQKFKLVAYPYRNVVTCNLKRVTVKLMTE